jgi:hypothetical protein
VRFVSILSKLENKQTGMRMAETMSYKKDVSGISLREFRRNQSRVPVPFFHPYHPAPLSKPFSHLECLEGTHKE